MSLLYRYYFVKGVDRKYPNRWYLSASPKTNCVQFWDFKDVHEVENKLKKLGFNPGKKYKTYKHTDDYWSVIDKEPSRNLFITFKNKSDEAYFVMSVANGFDI